MSSSTGATEAASLTTTATAGTAEPVTMEATTERATIESASVAANENSASPVAIESAVAAQEEVVSGEKASDGAKDETVSSESQGTKQENPMSEDAVPHQQTVVEKVEVVQDAASGADAATEASAAGGKRKEIEAPAKSIVKDESSLGKGASPKKQKVEEKTAESKTAKGHLVCALLTCDRVVHGALTASFCVGMNIVDAAIASAPIMVSRDDMAKMEEDGGLVKFDVITNDGTPEHMVQLTTLKNIFAKQLPKMPKEYIVRLVFDRNHHSMVILKNGTHVIGGICYRPFQPNRFAEIAFCAINAADQVKGYGTRLMNHLKEYVKQTGITHFLTYADNYAIGYFKKQGFAKVVSMPKPNWFGYIKDYDGGTLMECTIHYQIDYLRITSMVHKQRKAIQDKIKERSRAHIVYPGLEKFAEGRLMDIYMIPGVKEAGWSQAVIRNSRIGTRDPGSLKTQLMQVWKAVSSHRSAWPFHEPVDTTIVVDYLDYIKDPVDLSLIAKRIENGQYISKAALRADLDRMCENCTIYNTPDTNYYKAAKDLQEFISRRIQIRDSSSKQ